MGSASRRGSTVCPARCAILYTEANLFGFFGTLDLSAAVDVYSDWVDACDAVAKEGPKEGGSSSVARADEGPSASAAPAVADEGLDDDY